MEKVDWRDYTEHFAHLRDIPFPKPGRKKTVDMLIGIDYPELHLSLKEVSGNTGEPQARLTKLGWTCIGNPEGHKGNAKSTHFARTHCQYILKQQSVVEEINSTLQRFWEIESVDSKSHEKIMSLEEKQAMDTVTESLVYKDNRYQVAIPWRNLQKPDLPVNREMTVHRLDGTEKRLMKNPKIAASYDDTIKEYIEKGYVRIVPESEIEPGSSWFLPHFPLVKMDRTTTKVRILFDASAKYKGESLNDHIHQGPKLQQELVDVLLRFRQHPVAVACDITKMYLHIYIAPEDRRYHWFLWRGLDTTVKPQEYEFTRLVFGVNCSPFLAQFVAQEHARKHSEKFPIGAETVLQSTYMDDSMDSVKNYDTGIQLYKELSELWGTGGMDARKWKSSSTKVMAAIPAEHRAMELNLEEGELPSEKTLGVFISIHHQRKNPHAGLMGFRTNYQPNWRQKLGDGLLKCQTWQKSRYLDALD
jgi:hypothetical protein